MAILIEGFTVVIRKESLAMQKHPGGIAGFMESEVPAGAALCADDDLLGVGFVTTAAAIAFQDRLFDRYALSTSHLRRAGRDTTIIDPVEGNICLVKWMDFMFYDWGVLDEKPRRVAIGWLADNASRNWGDTFPRLPEPLYIDTPEGWDYRRSLSQCLAHLDKTDLERLSVAHGRARVVTMPSIDPNWSKDLNKGR